MRLRAKPFGRGSRRLYNPIRLSLRKRASQSHPDWIVHLQQASRSFWWRCAWGETPVPIPNTMVKTQAADGTMLETAWESRWLPESGGVAQLGEHLPCKQGVRGSNPLISMPEAYKKRFPEGMGGEEPGPWDCTLKTTHRRSNNLVRKTCKG